MMRNVQVTLSDALAPDAVQVGLPVDPFFFRLAHALIFMRYLCLAPWSLELFRQPSHAEACAARALNTRSTR